MYRHIVLAFAMLAAIPAGTATAQVRIDMSLITCKEFVSSDAERQEMIAAWMSGYFRASRNQPVVDLNQFQRNKKAVTNYCRKNGGETVMSAIQRSAR